MKALTKKWLQNPMITFVRQEVCYFSIYGDNIVQKQWQITSNAGTAFENLYYERVTIKSDKKTGSNIYNQDNKYQSGWIC